MQLTQSLLDVSAQPTRKVKTKKATHPPAWRTNGFIENSYWKLLDNISQAQRLNNGTVAPNFLVVEVFQQGAALTH